jgi:hypothetical protein
MKKTRRKFGYGFAEMVMASCHAMKTIMAAEMAA